MCERCAELERLNQGLQIDLIEAYREYTRLRDLLLENGIAVEGESDERRDENSEELSL